MGVDAFADPLVVLREVLRTNAALEAVGKERTRHDAVRHLHLGAALDAVVETFDLNLVARFEAETPDFKLALEGDANGAGFLDVIEQYGSTPSGNLAKHYAGICYLRTGDLANAAAYLAKYKPVKGIPGAIVNAQNYGLQGDVAVEQQNYAQAVSFYKKAVEAADNNWTAPMYLRKAGLAEQAQGNNAAAAALYEKILYTYPASVEAREAEKLLGSVNNK